jgi:transposase-like protein
MWRSIAESVRFAGGWYQRRDFPPGSPVVRRSRVAQLLQRPLQEFRIFAGTIDGIHFHDQLLVVAMGITCEGYKIILGLRQGATENATVVTELLTDLQARGLDFAIPRLYVLDGSKA